MIADLDDQLIQLFLTMVKLQRLSDDGVLRCSVNVKKGAQSATPMQRVIVSRR